MQEQLNDQGVPEKVFVGCPFCDFRADLHVDALPPTVGRAFKKVGDHILSAHKAVKKRSVDVSVNHRARSEVESPFPPKE